MGYNDLPMLNLKKIKQAHVRSRLQDFCQFRCVHPILLKYLGKTHRNLV